MTINERVNRLRSASLRAVPTLSPERGRLMTEFYRQNSGPMSAAMRRARSFAYFNGTQDDLYQPWRADCG